MNKLSLGDKASSGKANHWVDPSFIDLPEEGFLLSGRRKQSQFLSESKMKRTRKKREDVASPHLLIESYQRHLDDPWVDRYSPCSKAELAVHKKKIEEVENWMRFHANTSKGGILLLSGPSGCGKTATVQVLSLELGLKVQEWTNSTNLEPHYSSHYEWINGLSCSSQIAQFQEFLLRANKYNCLKLAGEGEAIHRKLILVEDFPNVFYKQPVSLHGILRSFIKTSRCPLVFIVSDNLSGNSSSRFLFPKEIQEELDICNISFNPVAQTTVMKVLTCISTLEEEKSCGRTCFPDRALLETLCLRSSGDIRSAINDLQFFSFQDTPLERGLGKMKAERPMMPVCRTVYREGERKKSFKETRKQEEKQAIGGKDASLFLFRALGKILHCKRQNHKSAKATEIVATPCLPSHLSHHHREVLQVDPEVVVERSHMTGEFFNLYLHQNYLDFFSEIGDVDRATKYLSDADLLTADWMVMLCHPQSRSTMGDYGSLVATRGLLHSNSQQVSVGFRPLHKPNWLLINKKLKGFCLSPVSLQTELLPYLVKLNNPLRKPAQISFIQDVGRMSLKRFPSRLKLETLTDNELGQMEIEGEDEKEESQVGGEGSLSASQPQPTSNNTFLEDRDMIIEEYTSD
ncbi:cell cycle checkpoint protein RAD17 isoform X3 [Mugil cephalus]|uniref:cell cycle checkpoint protein RAD17 isoform X3 n=1 Tax=Mugil cephalus TaxID=48193 RepID=UPI001FB67C41|nr:cell cycle checkpoint protein RAD17 isoform X3 [Mugil cephalus]